MPYGDTKTELAGKTQNHLRNYCVKCKSRIVSHLWIYRGEVYCGGSCPPKKSQFEKTYRALEKMRKDKQDRV